MGLVCCECPRCLDYCGRVLVFVSDGGEEAVARLPPRHRHRLLRPHLLRGGLGHHPDQVHPREYLECLLWWWRAVGRDPRSRWRASPTSRGTPASRWQIVMAWWWWWWWWWWWRWPRVEITTTTTIPGASSVPQSEVRWKYYNTWAKHKIDKIVPPPNIITLYLHSSHSLYQARTPARVTPAAPWSPRPPSTRILWTSATPGLASSASVLAAPSQATPGPTPGPPASSDSSPSSSTWRRTSPSREITQAGAQTARQGPAGDLQQPAGQAASSVWSGGCTVTLWTIFTCENVINTLYLYLQI